MTSVQANREGARRGRYSKAGAKRVLAVLGRAALRPFAIAIVLPIVVDLISYGVAWGLGLASFVPVPGAADGLAGLGGLGGLARAVFRAVVVGVPLGIVTVAGEEIGWRGCMEGGFLGAGLRAPEVVGGLIWAAWHTPLILTGQYAGGPHALAAVLGFAMPAVGLHILWSEWLTRTGSLWSAIIGHTTGEGASASPRAFSPTSGEPRAPRRASARGV